MAGRGVNDHLSSPRDPYSFFFRHQDYFDNFNYSINENPFNQQLPFQNYSHQQQNPINVADITQFSTMYHTNNQIHQLQNHRNIIQYHGYHNHERSPKINLFDESPQMTTNTNANSNSFIDDSLVQQQQQRRRSVFILPKPIIEFEESKSLCVGVSPQNHTATKTSKSATSGINDIGFMYTNNHLKSILFDGLSDYRIPSGSKKLKLDTTNVGGQDGNLFFGGSRILSPNSLLLSPLSKSNIIPTVFVDNTKEISRLPIINTVAIDTQTISRSSNPFMYGEITPSSSPPPSTPSSASHVKQIPYNNLPIFFDSSHNNCISPISPNPKNPLKTPINSHDPINLIYTRQSKTSPTTGLETFFYHCPCNKTFEKLCGLKSHIKYHMHQKHRLTSDSKWTTEAGQPVDIETEATGRKYGCGVCFRKFLRMADLKRHFESKHDDDEKKKTLECGVCLGRFSRSDALFRHQKAKRCRPVGGGRGGCC